MDQEVAAAAGDPRSAHRRYVLALGVLFALLSTALAIAPWHRQDWALENALVAVAIIALVLTYKRLPLSRVSYTLIFQIGRAHV